MIASGPTVRAGGASIPALGFGTWQLRGRVARDSVAEALRVGYRHVDTAQIYDNEAEVGAGVRASGLPRAEIFVTTKVWTDRFRDGDLQRSAEESLGRLGIDRVDLLLLHWPNPEIPLAETIGALNDARARGLTAHIGVSNFPAGLVREAVRLSAAPLAVNQVEHHPFLDQSPVRAALDEAGMALMAYTPLAKGRVAEEPAIIALARAHRRTPAQVALRWLVQQGVCAIPRSSNPERIRENFGVFDFELSPNEMATVSALGRRDGRLTSPSFAPDWD